MFEKIADSLICPRCRNRGHHPDGIKFLRIEFENNELVFQCQRVLCRQIIRQPIPIPDVSLTEAGSPMAL